MSAYVPTLSRAGWCKNPEEKIDFLLSDFFTSNISQSYLFANNVASLTYLIQRYQGNVPSLLEAMRTTLLAYFNDYFDNTVVDVTSDMNSAENQTGNVTITLYISVEQDGQAYSVGKVVQISDGKFKSIIQLNNTGETS